MGESFLAVCEERSGCGDVAGCDGRDGCGLWERPASRYKRWLTEDCRGAGIRIRLSFILRESGRGAWDRLWNRAQEWGSHCCPGCGGRSALRRGLSRSDVARAGIVGAVDADCQFLGNVAWCGVYSLSTNEWISRRDDGSCRRPDCFAISAEFAVTGRVLPMRSEMKTGQSQIQNPHFSRKLRARNGAPMLREHRERSLDASHSI